MEVKTYRAKSLQEALQMVRRDLGPDAAVLHTREVAGGLMGLLGSRQIEVLASVDVDVPSRFSPAVAPVANSNQDWADEEHVSPRRFDVIPGPADEHNYRTKFRQDLKEQIDDLQSMVEDLCLRSTTNAARPMPEAFARLYAELVEADVDEQLARDLLERLRVRTAAEDWDDPPILKVRLARMIAEEIDCSGAIQVSPGHHRLVALVGPTGVGKTTTIAKLAAHFHLRQKREVGLITVDTYRIAAVDQLRTYADIIDLPMEVVSTPREMRSALAKLRDRELVLMDTAGRSPSDDIKIQELRSLLAEAQPDEVHLVLSSVASPSSIQNATERFSGVGATGLMLTKLDEAPGIGGLLSLLHGGRLPLSYVTTGQNVPDDIAPAEARKLARQMLGMEGAR